MQPDDPISGPHKYVPSNTHSSTVMTDIERAGAVRIVVERSPNAPLKEEFAISVANAGIMPATPERSVAPALAPARNYG